MLLIDKLVVNISNAYIALFLAIWRPRPIVWHLIGNLEAAPLENGEVEVAWEVAKRTIVLVANLLLDKNLIVFL